jgi:Xaa-Pro dipeptidase
MIANAELPKEVFCSRLEATQRIMAQKGLAGLIAVSSFQERQGHVAYLTNHHIAFPNGMSHTGLGYAAALVPAEGKAALVAPLGYDAEKIAGIERIYSGPNWVKGVLAAIKDMKLESQKIGISGMDVLPVEYYSGLTQAMPKTAFETADSVVESQRVVKDHREIELLRNAARVADAALQAGLTMAGEGATPLEIETAVRAAAMRSGADLVAHVRVSTGESVSAYRWPMVARQPLERGDWIFLEVTGWRDYYGFDASRVALVGKPSEEQKEYLTHLVEATQWMIDELKPGREFRFTSTESRGRMIRPMAHGIGLEIFENPWLVVDREFVLSPGMVLCVEPVVASKQFGEMAIKEMILITDTGTEILTSCPLQSCSEIT